MKIIISINPEYVEKILSGEKKFEYRTKVAKQRVDTLIIYATKPIMKVVAEVEILGVIATLPEELWNQTCVNLRGNKFETNKQKTTKK